MKGRGQCNNAQVKGSQFCLLHDGWHANVARKEEGLRNYRLTKFKARVDEFADNGAVKSLREEIGIVRLQLETIINQCSDETDLLMHSDRISKLVNQIQLLDKTQLFIICESIVQIIGAHVTDPDALEIISTSIIDTMTKVTVISPLDSK